MRAGGGDRAANMSVISVAPLFAKAIRSVHDRTSISNLFPEKATHD